MKDDLSPDAKTLLDAARASFSPGPARIAAVRAAIEARLGAPAPQGSEASLPTNAGIAAGSSAAPYAVLGLLAAVALAGVTAWVAWQHHPVAAPMAAAPAPVEMSAPAVRVASPATEPASPSPSPPTVNAEQLPTVMVGAPSGTPPVRSAIRPRTSKKEGPPPASAAERGVPRSAQDESGGDGASAPAPAEPEDSLAREVSLLRAARAALDGGDAARALALLSRHAQLWPGGVLAEERIATQVLALCALGRVADARAAARDLETVAPESPHLARVRASCVRGPAGAASP